MNMGCSGEPDEAEKTIRCLVICAATVVVTLCLSVAVCNWHSWSVLTESGYEQVTEQSRSTIVWKKKVDTEGR